MLLAAHRDLDLLRPALGYGGAAPFDRRRRRHRASSSRRMRLRRRPGASAMRCSRAPAMRPSWIYTFRAGRAPAARRAARPAAATRSRSPRRSTSACGRPFRSTPSCDPRDILISVELPDGVLQVGGAAQAALSRSTTYIFVLWMVGSSLVLLAVASLFMRNQVRSLRRLADAAESFGKGRDVPNFKLEGATEIRQAAAAFLIMRDRIQRQITPAHRDAGRRVARSAHAADPHEAGAGAARRRAGDRRAQIRCRRRWRRWSQGYLDFARGEGAEAAGRDRSARCCSRRSSRRSRRDGADDLAAPPERYRAAVAARRDAALHRQSRQQRAALRQPCLADRAAGPRRHRHHRRR